MKEYIKSALTNQYVRATIVGLAVAGASVTPYIQSRISTALQGVPALEAKTLEPTHQPKIYQIMCPEDFTPLKWTGGEKLNVTDVKAKQMYEKFNGEGHIPQKGRSIIYLEDINGDNIVVGLNVTEKEEVKDIHRMQDMVQQRTKRYNRQ